MRSAWMFVVMTGLSAALAGTGALAQDRPPPPPPPDEREAWPDPPMDGPDADMPPERMREFLNRRLEVLERQERVLREALERLDKGEPAERVRRDLRERMEGAMERMRGQPPMGPGGPDRPMRPRAGGPEDRGQRGGPGMPPGGRAGPREGPPGAGPGHGPGEPMLDRMMAVLFEVNPRMYERLSRLRRERPEEFRRVIEDFAPRLSRLADERDRFPERWKTRAQQVRLEMETHEAARRAAEDGEEAKAHLRELLNQQFDLRAKAMEEEAGRLRERAESITRELAEKRARREEEIEKRVKEMVERAGSRPE